MKVWSLLVIGVGVLGVALGEVFFEETFDDGQFFYF